MNVTLEYLLNELAKYLTEPRPVSERLITSGRFYTGWLRDRITLDQQILINGITCPSNTMQDTLRMSQHHIRNEFANIAQINILPYPYDDLDEMKVVVKGLIDHFNSPISTGDVIKDLEPHNKTNDRSSYLILTIVNTLVIT
jgi:hypothetical protein